MDNRDALISSINALNDRKERLLREISTIDEDLAIQHRQLARILNDDTPIYRLPNELLSEILISCQRAFAPSPRRRAVQPFQVIASHVSHRWRAVVLATPLLWNTIDLHILISNHTEGRMQAQLGAHLLRSGACFVDVTLDFLFMSAAEPYFDMLKKHAARWRRLAVATTHENVSAFSRLLADVKAPMLEHLSLSVGRPQNEADRPFSPRKPYITVLPTTLALWTGVDDDRSFTTTAPLLSFVRLAGYALGTLHPPLSAVTTLHLDGWTRHYISPEQLRTVLAAAPRLINLSLNQLIIHLPRDPTAPVPPPLVLSHLRQLRLRGPCSPAARFLSMVAMPVLHSLTLQHIDVFQSPNMPSVRSLTIDNCALDEIDVRGLFRTMPDVERFSMDESLPEIWEMLLPDVEGPGELTPDEEDEPWQDIVAWRAWREAMREEREERRTAVMMAAPRHWRKMHTLVLRDLQNMDVGNFCYLVTCIHDRARARALAASSRRGDDILPAADGMDVDSSDALSKQPSSSASASASTSSPRGLAKVCLDRRSRTVLRNKHKMTWLEERVVLENCDAPETWPEGLGYVDAHDLLE
ncbi:hypothetical protein BDN70DRAFT_996651 [Pholiota conissans]|uniref:F-box domain-containing protein n=1 Tax=Pholiota conissans TaxID=109636 RepID=A0A9P5YV12_9AGAR|nr:hypothetical protein BDN70DRAFT_996651 [Pholiota conissans]